jgi:hypothetical protein
MSAQREVFNEDPNYSNRTKKCVDFREGLAWSPLPNGRDPRLVVDLQECTYDLEQISLAYKGKA